MKKISTLLLVVAVALIGDGGRVLMQKRRSGSMHGGLWEFPGGKVEAGETPEQAALREIEEELGVRPDPAGLGPLSFASGFLPPDDGSGRPLVILLYTCRSWQGRPSCRDAEEICWFAPSDLPRLAMPPLDYPLAEALISSIGEKLV